jgi:DNA replication protein DnaC
MSFLIDTEMLLAELLAAKVETHKPCRGTGYISRYKPGEVLSSGVDMCECRREVAFTVSMADGGVPKEFWGVESFDLVHNVDAFEVAKTYALDLRRARREGRGFVLYGSNGTGKTTFGTLVLAKAVRAGFSVGYILAEDYVRSPFRGEEHARWVIELERADFLFLDEMGKEHRKKGEAAGGFDMVRLDVLIRSRRSAMLPTIIATNLSRTGFEERYGESIDSAVADRNEWLAFEPGDYRKGEVQS